MSQNQFQDHDHQGCIVSALATAEARCAAEGLRLTAQRKRVLEILLEEHRALGAYDILARLSVEGQNAQPPVAYRALDFLVSHGFAHRIERLNAYIACTLPDEGAHMPAFMICRNCDIVAETGRPEAELGLVSEAKNLGFAVECSSVELEGLCPTCREARP